MSDEPRYPTGHEDEGEGFDADDDSPVDLSVDDEYAVYVAAIIEAGEGA